MKAITEKVIQAIAELRPAFDKSGLASLWLTLSREGAIIGTLDARGRVQNTVVANNAINRATRKQARDDKGTSGRRSERLSDRRGSNPRSH
jgi:hypothetical protein